VDEDLTLADRLVCGEQGGLVVDRDLNAALTLAKRVGRSPERQNACAEERAGQGFAALVNRSPLQQEPDAFDASAEHGNFWRTVR
jgi:hypothetical protein